MKIHPFIFGKALKILPRQADLKGIEGRVLLAHSFITQAVSDIRRKLQKLGKGPETSISELVVVV